jgi:hypothetical protein
VKAPAFIASVEGLQALGKELNVEAHTILWGAPAHIAFAVLEADSLNAIAHYVNSIAITQDFVITPVQNVGEVVEFARMMEARAGK